MIVKNYIKKDQYFDSVFLMQMAGKINGMDGVDKISVGMGTPLNKDTLKDMELLLDEGSKAGPNDLIVAIAAQSSEIAEKVNDTFLEMLTAENNVGGKCYKTLERLCSDVRDVNLAVISVAGEFAGAEAKKALEQGMNVYMFSDNVPIEQEVKLKQLAEKKDLFMMGPSCGLCFINGIALGLCSKTRRGNIGIVGASGSGIQEVMTIIHRNGMGISHAIGTGSKDLSEEVSGITMIKGIHALEEDDQTSVIVLISKPPAPVTAKKVLDVVKQCHKPVVIQFINGSTEIIQESGAVATTTFEQTARQAMALAGGEPYSDSLPEVRIEFEELVKSEVERFSACQKYLRGIFCGGALAEEALTLIQSSIGNIYSNVAFNKEYMLDDPFKSYKDSLIDIGEEDFTLGRPHVAIDPTLRVERFVKEARDSKTAVILLDFLLGYAMHDDPAGIMADAIIEEKKRAEKEGRYLCVVASLCGTDLDPQGYECQKGKLLNAGVVVMDNNGMAARFAAKIIKAQRGGRIDE